MIQCQGLEKEVALNLMPGPSKGRGVSGGSDCSVYCSHDTAKLIPAQLPWSLEISITSSLQLLCGGQGRTVCLALPGFCKC